MKNFETKDLLNSELEAKPDYHECIINDIEKLCPYKEISGSKCSSCKIPDKYREELWKRVGFRNNNTN